MRTGMLLGLHLAASLWFFWVRSGHVRDARVCLARLLARYSAPTWVRTWGLHAAAHTAWFDGDQSSARTNLDDALLLALARADTRTRGCQIGRRVSSGDV